MLDKTKCDACDAGNEKTDYRMPIIGGPLSLHDSVRWAIIPHRCAEVMHVGQSAPVPGYPQYFCVEHKGGYALQWMGKESTKTSMAMEEFMRRIRKETMNDRQMKKLWSDLVSEFS